MNGYVEAGYVVVLGTLAGYGASVLGRERAARRRVNRASGQQGAPEGGRDEISGLTGIGRPVEETRPGEPS